MQQEVQDEAFDVARMETEAVIGFNGRIRNGLQVHPDRQHLIYPLGCAVVIEDISSSKTEILWGHTDEVVCIAVSNKGGELLASGQKTHMGFHASAIVWEYGRRCILYRLELHKVNIQALVFSPNDLYLASLGGFDDGSVVIWNMKSGDAICGAPAQVNSAGNTLCISFSKTRDTTFVTGGQNTLRVWELDVENRKIRPTDVNMGQVNRIVQCLAMDDANPSSPFFYCGTTTGDVLAINMGTKLFQYNTPGKMNFQMGVTALAQLKNGNFLVGSGSGTLAELKFTLPGEGDKPGQAKSRIIKEWKNEKTSKEPKDKKGSEKSIMEAAITSISLRGSGHQFFVGTENGGMFKFSLESQTKGDNCFGSCELIKTSHSDKVNDVVFPPGSSALILTCQREQVRIWTTKPVRELKRYIVANKNCNTVALAADGQAIVSGWDDGVIRICSFSPKDNHDIILKHEIMNAHNKGVTALACTNTKSDYGWDFTIISGGGEGQVRIWHLMYNGREKPTHRLVENLKEHKGQVSSIKINGNNTECVTSSMDGTCIIWNLLTRVRKQMILQNTLFKCVMFDQDEVSIITCGTDRKIGYWACFDGGLIRDVEGAKSGSINCMDLSRDGQYFVSGGADKLLKVWGYTNANTCAVGMGHSAEITAVKICPRQKLIASASEDGAIVFWKFPF